MHYGVSPMPAITASAGAAVISAKVASDPGMGVLLFVILALVLYLLIAAALMILGFGHRAGRRWRMRGRS